MSIEIPEALTKELRRMRRDPAPFSVVKMVQCALGCGKAKAFSLTHPECPEAGTWCAQHGWLSFPSNQLRPIGEEYAPQKRVKKAA